MIGDNMGLIELTLSGALGLGFCIYQYVAITRDIARGKREKDDAASTTGAGHSHGEHRLDDR